MSEIMGRPTKEGIDYFSHDINRDDEKIEYLEAEHGLIGYAVYFKLLEDIYGKKGYYTTWNERKEKLFAKKVNVDINDISAIINTCLSEHLFCPEMYNDYQILTSNGIQKRYFEIVKRRKELSLYKEYLFLHTLTEFLHTFKGVVAYIGTQSKVKYSKVNNSKVKKSKKEISFEKIPDNLKSVNVKILLAIFQKFPHYKNLYTDDEMSDVEWIHKYIKSAIKKTHEIKGTKVNDAEILESLKLILDNWPDFYKDKFSIKTFASNFKSIISQVQNAITENAGTGKRAADLAANWESFGLSN